MSLTENGYHRPTYDEILRNKIQTAKELFGEDIETDEKTPLGKFIRIGAQDLSKAYEDLEATYYARFPNTASGISLDRLCVFAGITRNSATQALHIVRVYSTTATDTDTEIGIGELVVCGEDNEITFYSANTYTLPPNGGSVDVVVECAEAGTIGNVEIITNIVNPIAEIDRIEYVGIKEKGTDGESDYDLRKRFSVAIAGAGSANENAIRAALMRVANVTSAGVITNDTDTADSDGRPPRSFECFVCVDGDLTDKDYKAQIKQEIAEAIFDKAPIGIKTCTTTNEPKVTLYDEGENAHDIYFSFTQNIPIYIEVYYRKNSNFEENGEIQIKDKLVEYINGLGIGQDVILSALYGYIYSVKGIADVTEISMSTEGDIYDIGNIGITEWQAPQTNASFISLIDIDDDVFELM